ncbi:MAG TPA: nuclear transport factor 2 family protein [Micromonosporaceae bacterium]|jgi:ketosteroid isomerase-like protein|nr:nuclear transport factor 2 family protein [Micromonosporaceae bacterium]
MTELVDVDRVRRAIALFHTARPSVLRAMFTDDILWRVPHTHPLAADIEGIDDVLAFLQRVQDETDGTFSATPIDLAVSDTRIFCLMRVQAKRRGKALDQHAVSLWRMRGDGRICERELFLEDPAAADDFWSY